MTTGCLIYDDTTHESVCIIPPTVAKSLCLDKAHGGASHLRLYPTRVDVGTQTWRANDQCRIHVWYSSACLVCWCRYFLPDAAAAGETAVFRIVISIEEIISSLHVFDQVGHAPLVARGRWLMVVF